MLVSAGQIRSASRWAEAWQQWLQLVLSLPSSAGMLSVVLIWWLVE